MFMKNRKFSNACRNHKFQGAKIKLCVMTALLSYFSKIQKSNFKVGGWECQIFGNDRWKSRAKYEKGHFPWLK